MEMDPNTFILALAQAAEPASAVNESAVNWLWGIAIASTLFFVVMLFFSFGDFGGDIDGDVGADPGAVKYLSMLGMMVLLASGSWTALLSIYSFQLDLMPSIGIGCGAGIVGMVIIAQVMRAAKKLEQDGTMDASNAKGKRGEVYIRIPPAGTGEGKVRVEIDGRMRDFRAVTEDDKEIDSFTPVIVTEVSTDHVLRVRRTG